MGYTISYIIDGEVESVVEIDDQETQYVISGLIAKIRIYGIKVRAKTKFGHGDWTDPIEASTSGITAPSKPGRFVISEVGRAHLLLSWDLPYDKGGDIMVTTELKYSVGGRSFEFHLGQNLTSYRINGLEGRSQVSNIYICAYNSAGRGLSRGPLESQTLPSNEPVITSVAGATTLSGESTVPQAFHVSDSETAASSLRVKAHSTNEHLIPVSGIAIWGISSQRFVIVTPVKGMVGTARITLVVHDSEDLTAQSSFSVTVEPAWQLLWPTVAYSSGGTEITISGAGFVIQNETQYRCVFKANTEGMYAHSVATVDSSSKLLCTSPKWMFPAQVTHFSLTLGDTIVSASAVGSGPHGLYLFAFTEIWYTISLSSVLAIGGTRVTISGFGFDPSSTKYSCVLSVGDILMKGTNVEPRGPLEIAFGVPSWGLQYAANTVIVHLRNDGLLVPRSSPSLQTIILSESWSSVSYLANQLKTTVNSEGGETITIIGSGFDTSRTIQYQCSFTEKCCQKPPCTPIECMSMSSHGVYSESSNRIKCQFPSWGTLLPYSGATSGSVYTMLKLFNTHRQADVEFSGDDTFEYEFQELFKNLFPQKIAITGGAITIFGSGFDPGCAASIRGCYRCVYSAPGAVTLYGASKACSDSSCKGALSVPTSTKEISCVFPNWGAVNSAGQILVTLLHETGHVVSHISQTPTGGKVADKFLLTEESWTSFRPRAAYLTNNTEITVTGAGFDTLSQYACDIRSVHVFSRNCAHSSDCVDALDKNACASSASCVSSKCSLQVSYSIKSVPKTLFQIVCRINATQWGECFPAATTKVVVSRQQGSTFMPVMFNGAPDADKLVYAESWKTVSPASGDKFGFEDISVTGTGFDIKDNYFLRFTYQSTSLTSDIVLPTSPTRIVFKTPNWASRSGMGGAGALTTLTLFHGDVEVQALTAELSYEFLES